MDKKQLTLIKIIDYLEIKPPFLMIDKVEEIIPGKSCYAVKKLTKDDWFFKCHLEKEQIMPGTLQIETMLQTLVLTVYTLDDHKGKLTFVKKVNSNLISKVQPGNNLHIYATLESYKRGIVLGKCRIEINKKCVSEGQFTLVSPHELLIPKKV